MNSSPVAPPPLDAFDQSFAQSFAQTFAEAARKSFPIEFGAFFHHSNLEQLAAQELWFRVLELLSMVPQIATLWVLGLALESRLKVAQQALLGGCPHVVHWLTSTLGCQVPY
jgi:hypothetical protein